MPVFLQCSAVFWSFAAFFIIIFSTIYTYKILRKEKKILSKRTYNLYRSLIYALIVEMGVFAVLVGPCTGILIGLFLQLSFTPIISTSTLMFVKFYPLASHIITIIYIGPFRRGVLLMLKKNVVYKKLFMKNQVEGIEIKRTKIFSLMISRFNKS
jgi:hypothetical protein